jgi:tripartite-type tricarboxylate transporter receptor subunit TctC
MKIAAFALACIASALAASAAQAQVYPDRAVRIIVPFAPGGAVDILGRIIGAKLQDQFKQPFIIENRPGVGGHIAAEAVSRAAPDGYTMLLTTVGHAIGPSIYKKLSFDPVTSFTPITQLISASLLLVTTPKFEAKDLQSLIATARARPGALNYGSTGLGNPLHLTMEMLKGAAKIDVQMVPFRGDAPLNQALVQGDVEMAVVPMGTARPLVEAGSIRAIAVTGAKRSSALPNVPTVAEQGFPGFDSESWQGLFFPANTPTPIVETIYKATLQVLQDPEIRQRIANLGSEPVGSDPKTFAAFLKAEVDRYARIVQEAKVPLQD